MAKKTIERPFMQTVQPAKIENSAMKCVGYLCNKMPNKLFSLGYDVIEILFTILCENIRKQSPSGEQYLGPHLQIWEFSKRSLVFSFQGDLDPPSIVQSYC